MKGTGAGAWDPCSPEAPTFLSNIHVVNARTVQIPSMHWFGPVYPFSTMTGFVQVPENCKSFLLGIIRTRGNCVLKMEMGYEVVGKIGIEVFVVKPWVIFP